MKAKSVGIVPVVLLAMSLGLANLSRVNAQAPSAGTPQGQELKDLRDAKKADWEQANDNRGTVKGPLLVKYEDKVEKLQSLIKRMKKGQQVPEDEVESALKPVVE
jgi:hypothetical protein